MPDIRKSWWHTTPGILVGGAAVVTGLIGIVLQLNASGDEREAPLTSAADSGMKSLTIKALAIPRRSDRLSAQHSPGAATLSNVESAPALSTENILAAENGGRLVVADNDSWLKSIDGQSRTEALFRAGKSAPVYAFRNRRSATFDTFRIFIGKADSGNVKEFELLAGSESAEGPFESIGTFQTENTPYLGDSYQEFSFPPTSGKYLKMRILSSWGRGDGFLQEIQLLGAMDESHELAQLQE